MNVCWCECVCVGGRGAWRGYVEILPLHGLASNVNVFGCVVVNVCACVRVNACGFEYVWVGRRKKGGGVMWKFYRCTSSRAMCLYAGVYVCVCMGVYLFEWA